MTDGHVKPMQVGAIGVGIHALTSILPNLPGAGMTLAATCAQHLDRAEAAAARFGAGAAFDDAERMLDAVPLDGVVVVVPPDRFSGVVWACIRSGIPVFAEKPAANDAAEAADLAAQAAESGVPVVVGFAGAYRLAKELMGEIRVRRIDDGLLHVVDGPVRRPVRHARLAVRKSRAPC